MELYSHQLSEMKEVLQTWLSEVQKETVDVVEKIDDLQAQKDSLENRKEDLDEAANRIECMIDDLEQMDTYLFGGS